MDIRTLQEMAVRSVQERGFYDNLPPVVDDRLLMAQWLRFVEEVGELSRALRKGNGAADEMADVLIVLFQLAHVLGVDLEAATPDKLQRDEARGHLHNGAPAEPYLPPDAESVQRAYAKNSRQYEEQVTRGCHQ
jgi:NTP pyrophosphatase (non-canonical NTP hydrolase)